MPRDPYLHGTLMGLVVGLAVVALVLAATIICLAAFLALKQNAIKPMMDLALGGVVL